MEAPALGKIQEEFGGQGVEVVAVNIVPQNSLQEWQAFWKRLGAGDVVWAQDTPDGQAVGAYNIQALGTTVIVGRDGRVTYRDAVATSYKMLRTEVLNALD
ncbi:MAG: TlpA family protein disulfide reductase [Anaerolineae bacterium]